MDCVTCILVGMCMLCGPGFGAGKQGRRMTRAEIDASLKNYLKQFARVEPVPKATTPPSISYNRRQSFIADPRYAGMGIGKRQMDPNQYPPGIEQRLFRKRNYLKRTSWPFDTNQGERTAYSYDQHAGMDFGKRQADPHRYSAGIGKRLFHKRNYLKRTSLPFDTNQGKWTASSYDQHAGMGTEMAVEKWNEIIESERRKLQERREKFGVDPFITMLGIGK